MATSAVLRKDPIIIIILNDSMRELLSWMRKRFIKKTVKTKKKIKTNLKKKNNNKCLRYNRVFRIAIQNETKPNPRQRNNKDGARRL